MSATRDDGVCELLKQSLVAWRLAGNVGRASDGTVHLTSGSIDITVERAPADLPFRWIVTTGGRKRVALALPAVLRQVREALDPDYARDKVHVAVTSLVAS
jgi:hypothetical protein